MRKHEKKTEGFCRYCWWKNLLILIRIRKEKPADRLMKNFLTQWELRRKTDPKLKLQDYCFFLTFLVERRMAGRAFVCTAGPSRRRLNRWGSKPSGVKSLKVKPLEVGQKRFYTAGPSHLGGVILIKGGAVLVRGKRIDQLMKNLLTQ